jgi:hypothetical protein
MEKSLNALSNQLKVCLKERCDLANELQNEVNQTLASVLLWIQHAKIDNNIMDDPSLKNAERSNRSPPCTSLYAR